MFIFVTAAMADKKEGNPKKVQRFGMVTGLKPEKLGHYKQLHAAAWPGVLKKIKECNSQNYSIYLQKIAEQIANYVGQNDLTSFLMRLGKSTHKSKLVLGCACQQLNGIDDIPQVMNSVEFARHTIGITGKWRKLIGDPSRNFTAMVFGKPKMGKSYLCIDFAGYLARHHGKVLYVAKEEGLDMTLQKMLQDKRVAHPNLFVASLLPASLTQYDLISSIYRPAI